MSCQSSLASLVAYKKKMRNKDMSSGHCGQLKQLELGPSSGIKEGRLTHVYTSSPGREPFAARGGGSVVYKTTSSPKICLASCTRCLM